MKANGSRIRLFWQEMKKHSYFKQLFYTYALISCLLFFLFSSLIIYYINNDYRNTLMQVQDQNINQAYRLNQTVLQDIYGTCYTILEDGELSRILYSSNYNTNMALNARELHDQIRQSSSLIHSVYFINYCTNTVIDNYSRSSLETHYDTELFAFMEQNTPSRTPFYGLPRTISWADGSKQTSARVFSIIYQATSRGAIVINIDYDTYAQLLQLESNDYLEWVEVDHNGQIFAASDPALFAADYTEDSVYQKITGITLLSGSFETMLNGNSCRITYRHNSGMDITYFSSFNQSALYTSNHLLWIVLLCGVCFILFGMLVTFGVSLFVYRPFRSFKQQLTQTSGLNVTPQAAGMDDFTYLSNIYTDIAKANQRLQTINHDWLKEQDRAILKKLLINTVESSRILPEQYESLSQYFSGQYYQIVIISIDYPSRQKEDIGGISLLRYAISNVMNELFDSGFLYMNMDLIAQNTVYFLNHDDKSGDSLLKILKQGQDFLQTHFQITLSVGIGEAVTDLDEISISYSGAQEALSHRFLTGSSSVNFAADLNLTPPRKQYYPYEADAAAIAAIKAMDREELKLALEQFFGEIRMFHLDQLIRSILQLDASMQRFENSAGLTLQMLPWDLDVLSQLDVRTLFEYLYKRGLQDIDELTEIKNHSAEKPELIQHLMELIDNNLYNPNLSVAFLAGEVHLSVNYLRSIFKENTGDSLSNYITRKKIELICDLLANTDTSIQDISDRLGFSTKNYFFTFFKKHTKMTPSEYRKSRREAPAG